MSKNYEISSHLEIYIALLILYFCVNYVPSRLKPLLYVRFKAKETFMSMLFKIFLILPRVLFSVHCTAFSLKLLDDVTHICHIIRKTTCNCHPRTDDLIEPFHRTIFDMISMYMNVKYTNCYINLSFATFASNTATHAQRALLPCLRPLTNISPQLFFMMFQSNIGVMKRKLTV